MKEKKYSMLDGMDGRLENTEGLVSRMQRLDNTHRLGVRDERLEILKVSRKG